MIGSEKLNKIRNFGQRVRSHCVTSQLVKSLCVEILPKTPPRSHKVGPGLTGWIRAELFVCIANYLKESRYILTIFSNLDKHPTGKRLYIELWERL